ncbi:MAG: hypothetical protein ACRDNS_24960 [Trebonia sp.]
MPNLNRYKFAARARSGTRAGPGWEDGANGGASAREVGGSGDLGALLALAGLRRARGADAVN